MMKVGNNYENQNLNKIYRNNHFEHAKFSFENMICSNVDKVFCKKRKSLNNSEMCVMLNLNGLDGILIWKIIYKKSWKCILVG